VRSRIDIPDRCIRVQTIQKLDFFTQNVLKDWGQPKSNSAETVRCVDFSQKFFHSIGIDAALSRRRSLLKKPKNTDLKHSCIAAAARAPRASNICAAAPQNPKAKELLHAVSSIRLALRSERTAKTRHTNDASQRGALIEARRISATSEAVSAQNWLAGRTAERMEGSENPRSLTLESKNASDLEVTGVCNLILYSLRSLNGDNQGGRFNREISMNANTLEVKKSRSSVIAERISSPLYTSAFTLAAMLFDEVRVLPKSGSSDRAYMDMLVIAAFEKLMVALDAPPSPATDLDDCAQAIEGCTWIPPGVRAHLSKVLLAVADGALSTQMAQACVGAAAERIKHEVLLDALRAIGNDGLTSIAGAIEGLSGVSIKTRH
jgi:hypothetical protein